MTDDEPTEFLAMRRSKRSTAGNRMELALAELGAEDLTKDQEDDRDFHVGKEEVDIFESDFESTDDEAQPGEEEAGDKQVQEEEKRERKTSKFRTERALAAAHERQRATFDPEAFAQPKELKKPKTKSTRRVSLGVVVDAETGQVLQGEDTLASSVAGKRKSKRRHTILNTSATVSRMRLEEEKRASAPKKSKIEAKVYTQDELIARALDNEEGNIVSHRNYLQLEDEKRRRAKVVRTTISGPVLRWVSKVEKEKVQITVEAPPKPQHTTPQTFHMSNMAGYGPGPVLQLSPMPFAASSTLTYGQYPYTTNLPYTQAAAQAAQNYRSSGPTTTSYSGYASWLPYQPQPPPSPQATEKETTERIEKVAKSYVMHELDQREDAPKPGWKESMEAMFGDHVQWQDLKVFSGKNRPLGRPKHKCPITGRPAKYLDPRTGVPFADVQAFKVLTKVLEHEYVWSPNLGSYLGHEAPDDAQLKSVPVGHETPRQESATSGRTVAMDTT